ncbi:hypothetical protein [Paracnuella aquatica]|uniref:hypothetical protein n=1 Tax=Paracnuella aquatica TaxID=2268757 RepID=UPI000F4E8E63|nr:hypothetical protein [Paracnuella aquatica]RPD46748.1 hypothetical protein DRJ53_13515 [Paracnuella aquatica]
MNRKKFTKKTGAAPVLCLPVIAKSSDYNLQQHRCVAPLPGQSKQSIAPIQLTQVDFIHNNTYLHQMGLNWKVEFKCIFYNYKFFL